MNIRNYIYSHCIEPQKVPVFDSYLQTQVIKEFPCGKCLHCRNNHVNSWTTRLYAQAMYSNFVYYITLDYAPFNLLNSASRKLAAETAACYHNLNLNKSYGMHPLLLQKNHLQDFLKRFRKNTGKKIQYFGCGEYGTHANGRGFGRPHFHLIVFSNSSISQAEFESAWTINGYKIGRVDFHDLRANGSFDDIKNINIDNKYNAKYVFKYVCKYLQKGSFDFENLSTIDFHREYFKTLQETQINTDSLFPESVPITDTKQLGLNWDQYVKDYSPFVVCSRRPAIGLQYFEDNFERFSKQDFKLFGLSEECFTFPTYFVRKTKERLCSFAAVGNESGSVSSNSRVGVILYQLYELFLRRSSVENLEVASLERWRPIKNYKINADIRVPNQLHLYDLKNRIFYQFNGYGYTLWRKVRKLGYIRVQEMDIIDVFNMVEPVWCDYHFNFLRTAHFNSVLSENEMKDTIRAVYGDNDAKFREDVYAIYQSELATLYKTKLLTQNSKISL